MKMIKILYVHSSDEMYGADLSLLQLVIRLDQSIFEPIVVLPNDVSYAGLLSKALAEHDIRVLKCRMAILRRKYFNPLGIIFYLWRLMVSTFHFIDFIKHEGIDIVHTNTIAVIPGALAAWLTRKPHIWHVREIIVQPKLLWRLTSWIVSRLSTRVIVNSVHTKEHLCAGNQHNRPKTDVVYNGIDVERFDAGKGKGHLVREEWGILDGQLLVGMVGRVSHWKGQEYFLRVAKLVSSQHPETRFALVGGTAPGQEGYFLRLKSIVEDLSLENLVILSDYRTDIPVVLDAYDIFVLPSTQPEPFGNVVLEAMAMRKPVIANAHGG
ncbi:MAG TPA: glycosyltransferase, partial [Bacteroidetes bacterium]|nr:glycosyltransferase [Bacteroidota bacterium]